MTGVNPTGRIVRSIVGEGAETAADVAADAATREAADTGADRVVRDVAGGAPTTPGLRATDPGAALAPGAAAPPRFIDDRHRELAVSLAQVDREIMALQRANPRDPQIETLRQQWAPFRDELQAYTTIRGVDERLPSLRTAAEGATGTRAQQEAWGNLASAQREQAQAYARLGMDTEAARAYYEASLAFRSAANSTTGGPWMEELRAATLAAARSGYQVRSTGANFANQMRAGFGDSMYGINLQMLIRRADEVRGPHGTPNPTIQANTLAAGRAVLDEFRALPNQGNRGPISDAGWNRIVALVNRDPAPMDAEVFEAMRDIN